MRIAWIFPRNKLCGISFYSRSYVEALKTSIDVLGRDPEDFRKNNKDILQKINACHLVHIQYETSFFLSGRKDWYSHLCRSITRPIIVTLHEVYDRFPGVFPRSSIQGGFFSRKVKQWVYDRRHPYMTALTKHTCRNFYAKKILVHSKFQKDILIEKGIPSEIVMVSPIPVDAVACAPARPWSGKGELVIAATGFINDSYDYDLLLHTLAMCDLPWKFTWIGGIRRPDDREILQNLQNEIHHRHWRERFTITGIVSKDKRDALLSQTNIYCAFFKYKSSSESLAAAIGSRAMIIATPLPLTKEMSERFSIMMIAPQEPREMEKTIRQLAIDSSLQASLQKALAGYCEEYGRQRQAKRLIAIYEKEIGR
jgi:glycosyltransferase involved in cell wall biosynthesis